MMYTASTWNNTQQVDVAVASGQISLQYIETPFAVVYPIACGRDWSRRRSHSLVNIDQINPKTVINEGYAVPPHA